MNAKLDGHMEELHHLGNDLPKRNIPKGVRLVEAYLTDRKIIVMGQPEEDDETHNCDVMGCGFSHVLYRLMIPIKGSA